MLFNKQHKLLQKQQTVNSQVKFGGLENQELTERLSSKLTWDRMLLEQVA